MPIGSFGRILGFTAALLIAVLVGAAILPPPWSWAIGLVYIAYDTWLLSHMVLASRRALLRKRPVGERTPIRMAVIIAARNERSVVANAIDAVLAQTTPPERLLVVDDGSTDGTIEMIRARYGATHPILRVISKPHTGKARSLNEALRQIDEDVVVTLDADTVPDPQAMAAIRRAFESHPTLTAGCGVLRPVCAPGKLSRVFQLYQRFEYLRAFLWRLAWMDRGTLILLSGAFTAFRRDALIDAGGFDPDSLVEDYELMFRLHRRSEGPLDVRVIGDARATTDVPGSIAQFLRQRSRWFSGFLQTLFRYREMVGSKRYGRLGTFHLRVKTVDMLLPVYGLAAVVVLLWLLISGRPIGALAIAVIVAKLLFDLCCHFYSMTLYRRWQGERIDLRFAAQALLATLTEPLAFQLLRQLGAVLGWIAFLRGRLVWHPQRVDQTVRTLSSNSARSPEFARTRSSA